MFPKSVSDVFSYEELWKNLIDQTGVKTFLYNKFVIVRVHIVGVS